MIDETPAMLQADADAALSMAPPDPLGAVPDAPPADPVADWTMYTQTATQIVASLLLPQWHLTPVEKGELTGALAQILALHFPDGLDGKYAGYFRLIACGCIVVATRYAAGGGKLPPLGPVRVVAEQPAEPAATH